MSFIILISSFALVNNQEDEAGAEVDERLNIVHLTDSYGAGIGIPPSSDTFDPWNNKTCTRGAASQATIVRDRLIADGWNIGFNDDASCLGYMVKDLNTFINSSTGTSAMSQADLVIIRIGGNNAGFANRLVGCVLGICLPSLLLPNSTDIENVEGLLGNFYNRVSQLVSPGTHVLVIGYPNLVPSADTWDTDQDNFLQDCNESEGNWDYGEMRRLNTVLNDAIKRQIALYDSSSVSFGFLDAEILYQGHEICGLQDDWVNGFAAYPNLFHPKLAGYEAEANAIFGYVNNQFRKTDFDGIANTPSPGTSQYNGDIVKLNDGSVTSWFVGSDGYRTHIPTGGDFLCFEANGSSVHHLGQSTMNAISLRSGNAKCAPGYTPPPSVQVPDGTYVYSDLPLKCGVSAPYASTYDTYAGFNHGYAIDLLKVAGTPVVAPRNGTVTVRSDPFGYGNYIDLVDSGGKVHRFAHLQSSGLIATGTTVSKGQQIALVGTSGSSTGPHLHYEQRIGNAQVQVVLDGPDLVWGPRQTAGGDRYTVHELVSGNCGGSSSYSDPGSDYNGDGVNDIYVLKGEGTNSTELHIMDGKNPSRWLLQTATVLHRTYSELNWAFEVADYNRDGYPDIWVIKKQGTSSTELHIIDGKNPMRWLLQTPTVLHRTTDLYQFDVGDYNHDGYPDLWLFKQQGTDSTEVHIMDGSRNFSSWLLQTSTVLHRTGSAGNWEFELGDYNCDGDLDVYVIKKKGSNSTEVHIINGNAFDRWMHQVGTLLHRTGPDYNFEVAHRNGDCKPDIWMIKARGTNSTELHIINGAYMKTRWIVQKATVLHKTGSGTWHYGVG